MLAVVLKILSIIGIILLLLLCLVLLILLLVLFIPIVYRIDAGKTETELTVSARARWLFGFVRVNFQYPEPGRVIAKLLWKTLYDSGAKSIVSDTSVGDEQGNETSTDATGQQLSEQDKSEAVESQPSDAISLQADTAEQQADFAEDTAEQEQLTFLEKLFAKYEKIKYTIQQFCDKIKHIWNNISFYKKLLEDEQTKLLISHVFRRLGRILRHIRPRKLKVDGMFGTGSPDTTGYAYGVYSMFSPQLGRHVYVVPDFEQKILVGEVHASGHITIFTLLINGLAILFDKRLRLLIRRLKNHEARQNKQNVPSKR